MQSTLQSTFIGRANRTCSQDVSDGQLRSCEERRPRVFFLQFDLFIFVEHRFVALAEEKIEWLGDRQLVPVPDIANTGTPSIVVSVPLIRISLAARSAVADQSRSPDLPDIFGSEIDDARLKRSRETKSYRGLNP